MICSVQFGLLNSNFLSIEGKNVHNLCLTFIGWLQLIFFAFIYVHVKITNLYSDGFMLSL